MSTRKRGLAAEAVGGRAAKRRAEGGAKHQRRADQPDHQRADSVKCARDQRHRHAEREDRETVEQRAAARQEPEPVLPRAPSARRRAAARWAACAASAGSGRRHRLTFGASVLAVPRLGLRLAFALGVIELAGSSARSTVGLGSFRFMSSIVSAMICETARLRNHLWLDGITYHGACFFEQLVSASSKASI